MTRGLKQKSTTSWATNRKYISNKQEDEFVIDYFNKKTNGYLLDISAADGVTGSNSFKLIDEYYWSGLLVEPCPKHFDNLKILYDDIDDIDVYFGAIDKNRSELTFYELGYNDIGMSYTHPRSHGAPENCPVPIQNTYTVPAMNINTLFDVYNVPSKIDFFNLDIEGAEIDVITTINMDKYDIKLWCISIEPSCIKLYGEQVFIDFFKSNGYERLDRQTNYEISVENQIWGKI